MVKKKWKHMIYPEGEGVEEYLLKHSDTAGWKLFLEFIQNQPKTKEEKAIKILDEQSDKLIELYPQKKVDIENVRPYFIRRILRDEKIDDEYFNSLKDQ